METEEEASRTQSITDGFQYFPRHPTRTHQAAVFVGTSIWLLSIAAIPLVGPEGTHSTVWGVVGIAATVTSVYFVVLSLLAVGSPAGNIVAPGALVALTPGPLYRLLLPDISVSDPAVVPFTEEGGFAVPGLLVAMILPVVLLTVIYMFRNQPRRWEADTMPGEFSFIEYVNEFGERTRNSPATAVAVPPNARSLGGALFVFVIVATAILSVLLPSYITSPGDIVGSLVVVSGAVFVYFTRPDPDTDGLTPTEGSRPN